MILQYERKKVNLQLVGYNDVHGVDCMETGYSIGGCAFILKKDNYYLVKQEPIFSFCFINKDRISSFDCYNKRDFIVI